MFDLRAASGYVEPRLCSEFPGLRLEWLTVEARARPSPPDVKHRLEALSNRYRGGNVVTMRTQPIPHAYRAFFRQVGLNPDVDRIPSEEAAVARLLHGQFISQDLVEDARLIALIETGVPVWAVDADLVDPTGLGIRASTLGERLGPGEGGVELTPGRLVVADAACIHAVLFGALAPGHGVGSRTRRIALFSVGVDGVPQIHLEEALWVCTEALRGA
jgi:DNA/RNA-binding domain of Phe-tRNA-synthetase-like protein